MGTWDVDSFGNDDAADWAQSLEGCVDLSLVTLAIDAAGRVAGCTITRSTGRSRSSRPGRTTRAA